LNKGLESVARYLNLNADVGLKATDVKLALVLHGPATRAALNDSAYARHTTAKSNPNLDLIRELKACGVEVFVCGQSLARNQFAREEVAGDVAVAVSAMTVNVNKQQEGYSYLSIH
jgi:intracellular sulfur oxidation DsrE/DsrF family protein